MQLIIAEKPNMAAEIARHLPQPTKRGDGCIYAGNNTTVTWLYGHILRQADPGEYDEKFKKWSTDDLPIIPQEWKLKVTDSCKKQFKIIKELIGKADEIVHAGDPDREGQLLVDEVLSYVKNKKPVKRLLLNALDEKSVKKALGDLRNNKDFHCLMQSALARARADWLIGMNLSRAYTLAAKKAGHSITFPIGRVKTPTLSLVVRREEEINNFKPVDFYGLKALFKHEKGEFTAIWKHKEDLDGQDPEGRIINPAIVDAISLKVVMANTGVITSCVTTDKTEPQPLPLSLSSLQIIASKKYGYDPQKVLDVAQSLYEKKVTSYPRSDCDYLPESQFSDAEDILKNLRQIVQDTEIKTWASMADLTIKSRAWNDKKITAHHAIIPTTQKCDYGNLTAEEANIYKLVAQAYLAQFYHLHQYKQTKISVSIADETFVATGKNITHNGWKSLYNQLDNEDEKQDEDEKQLLPPVKDNDAVQCLNCDVEKKTTKPPQRFTSGTLIKAMKEIHKYVKNPDLKKQLKEVSGIGTEATRATIIKDLIEKNFLSEKSKNLVPTTSAFMLVGALPEDLTYPDKTALWEEFFHKMLTGEYGLTDFISNQTKFVTELCEKAGGLQLKKADVPKDLTCPECGNLLKQRKGPKGVFWGCSTFPDCKATCKDRGGKPVISV